MRFPSPDDVESRLRNVSCFTPFRPLVLLAGGNLFAALFGLTILLLHTGRHSAASVKPAAAPVVDQRLILHARTTRVSTLLTGGLRLAGTLYPTLPGPNTLNLNMAGQHPTPVRGGRVEVVATMPGMPTTPARAVLVPCPAGYCGRLTLPMFGHYRVQAAIAAPSGRLPSSLGIELPLPDG
jgi:hypothetical protein